jgi:outer membrane lipoprotein SlyB
MTQAKHLLSAICMSAAALALSGCFEEETAQKPEAQAEQAEQPAPPPACTDCGRVASIEKVTVEGESTGAGALGGAIVGVVVGNQVGSGSGKDVAKVVGGIGGAIAGNEAEKKLRAKTYYRVSVAMETGGTQVVEVADATILAVGDKVRVQGNNIVLR